MNDRPTHHTGRPDGAGGSAHDEVEVLLAAYAVDAVDADERRRIEDHLDRCPACRSELADHHAALAGLTEAVDEAPPERVWAGIAASLADVSPTGTSPPDGEGSGSRRWWHQRGLAPVLAAAAVLAVVAAGVVVTDDGADEPDLREAALAALESAPAAAAPLTTEEGAVVGRVAVLDDGTAIVLADLPDLGADEVYQLWALGEEVVSLGLLDDDGVLVSRLGTDPATVAVTAEPAGGSVVARGPVVATADLAA